jgi:hypothetical protein
VLRVDDFDVPVYRCELDFFAFEQFAVTNETFNIVCLEQSRDAASQLTHDARAAFLHRGDIHFDLAGPDAVFSTECSPR